jgi:4-hydroxybenzoate polyprenyltransferase
VLYALALAVCIVWYDADHENNWFSPALMGLNRVYVYATTAFALTPTPATTLWYGCGAMMSYLVGLTYLAKQENAVNWRSLWPLVLVVLPVGYPALAVLFADAAADVGLLVGLGVCLLAWIVRSVRLARPKAGVSQLKQGVVGLIAGIALIDSLGAALMTQPMWAAACVVLFLICLITQRSVAGT